MFVSRLYRKDRSASWERLLDLSKLLGVLFLHAMFSLKGGIHGTLGSPSGSATEVEALVKELDECVQLDCPIEPVCDDTEESAWTKRTERQEEKWSSLRPKLMEETLTYLGCADPNVSH